jgi:hypothetical protein
MAETAQAQAPPKKASGKDQRKWKNYLLNLRYQLKYTLTIVGVSLLLTGGLGYFIMSNAHEASRVVQVRAMDPDDTMAQELVKQMAHNDRVMMLILIAFGFVLCLVLTIYGILISHKVAGPLYKVRVHLDKIRDNRLGVVYPLRKGDELVDFFEVFKAAHDALRDRASADIALLDRAIVAAESAGNAQLANELRAARKQKADSLA